MAGQDGLRGTVQIQLFEKRNEPRKIEWREMVFGLFQRENRQRSIGEIRKAEAFQGVGDGFVHVRRQLVQGGGQGEVKQRRLSFAQFLQLAFATPGRLVKRSVRARMSCWNSVATTPSVTSPLYRPS